MTDNQNQIISIVVWRDLLLCMFSALLSFFFSLGIFHFRSRFFCSRRLCYFVSFSTIWFKCGYRSGAAIVKCSHLYNTKCTHVTIGGSNMHASCSKLIKAMTNKYLVFSAFRKTACGYASWNKQASLNSQTYKWSFRAQFSILSTDKIDFIVYTRIRIESVFEGTAK